MVDRMITTYDEVEDVYAGRYDGISHLIHVTKDPMDYFREADTDTSVQPQEEGYSENFPSQIPKTTGQRKKIGRNDPCSCGSGKKYKKCCMRKDQHLLS